VSKKQIPIKELRADCLNEMLEIIEDLKARIKEMQDYDKS